MILMLLQNVIDFLLNAITYVLFTIFILFFSLIIYTNALQLLSSIHFIFWT